MQAVALNPASQIHYIDHLAPMAIVMGIPLLFLEEFDYECGKKYYPGLIARKEDYSHFSPEYLIAHYDVSFMSDLWDRRTMQQKFAPLEQKYHKKWRNVHCPHGFSDKGFYLQKCAMEDIALLYGENMIDQLKHHGVWELLNRYVITGNYRYTFFQQHRAFYDDIFRNEIQSKFDRIRPLILYAPTWMDLEESTTFFDSYHHVLDQLPEGYNLLVKLHPRLELDDTVNYYRIIGRYEHKKNVYFLKDFPLIFPLLAHADLYLGDMSSVGYDFLIFNKPLFFLNKQQLSPEKHRGAFLFQCGIPIAPHDFNNLYSIMESNLVNDQERFSAIRKKIWNYTFGEERPFADIKADIIQAYST